MTHITQLNSTRMRRVVQPSLPSPIPAPDEIARKMSFAGALELCANAAGYDLDKQASAEIGMDKGQWSRIKAGTEGIRWERLKSFMDKMGNPTPVLWMLHECGFDLYSVRKRETELERRIRELEEENVRIKHEKSVIVEALTGRKEAA